MTRDEMQKLRSFQWGLLEHHIEGFRKVGEKLRELLDSLTVSPDSKCPECGNKTTLSRVCDCGWYEDYEEE